MIKITLPSSKRWLTGAAAGVAGLTNAETLIGAPWVDASNSIRREAALGRFRGGYDGVLGTSLDLIIEAARPSDAAECEFRLLAEIERLRRILSTYDSSSEIRRVMAGAPVGSSELAELLAIYETWSTRTAGLIDVNLGGVVAEWRAAALTGRLPERAALAQAARRAGEFNVDALGKGFIIDRAVAVARRFAPGGLVNLGGDIRAWGDTAWLVGIADSKNPSDNARPITQFLLREAAVATSGSYARYYQAAGKRFSHLIDPRTQWPAEFGGSATVVARDCVTANALSTAASIAGSRTGTHLAQTHGAAGYFFVDATGGVVAGGTLSAASSAPTPSPAPKDPAAPAHAQADWPAGFQVTVQVALKKQEVPRYYRPYVTVWIRDAQNLIVRTIAVWGEDTRWQRRLRTWWNEPRSDNTTEPATVARATRSDGVYTVVWNGADDFGRRLPTGNYTVCLEICREDGHHILEKANLACGPEPVTVPLRASLESEASTVSYGPANP